MQPNSLGSMELEAFKTDQIRNFSIIAHVGKEELCLIHVHWGQGRTPLVGMVHTCIID